MSPTSFGKRLQATRVVKAGNRVVNRAGAEHDEEPMIRPVENVAVASRPGFNGRRRAVSEIGRRVWISRQGRQWAPKPATGCFQNL